MQSFTKHYRLRKLVDFDNLRKGSRKYRDPFLCVYYKSNDLKVPRIGISVSSKYFPAVKRNKIKRLLRESFRKNKHKIQNIDFLVVAQNDSKKNFDFFLKNLTCSFREFLLKVSIQE